MIMITYLDKVIKNLFCSVWTNLIYICSWVCNILPQLIVKSMSSLTAKSFFHILVRTPDDWNCFKSKRHESQQFVPFFKIVPELLHNIILYNQSAELIENISLLPLLFYNIINVQFDPFHIFRMFEKDFLLSSSLCINLFLPL